MSEMAEKKIKAEVLLSAAARVVKETLYVTKSHNLQKEDVEDVLRLALEAIKSTRPDHTFGEGDKDNFFI